MLFQVSSTLRSKKDVVARCHVHGPRGQVSSTSLDSRRRCGGCSRRLSLMSRPKERRERFRKAKGKAGSCNERMDLEYGMCKLKGRGTIRNIRIDRRILEE